MPVGHLPELPQRIRDIWVIFDEEERKYWLAFFDCGDLPMKREFDPVDYHIN